MRLLTYNIRKGKGASGKGDGDVGPLGEALTDCAPDLVLCQEVFHSAAGDGSQSTALAKTLQMAAYYAPNKQRRRGHHGNATLTRWPVERWDNLDLSINRIERRGALYVKLATPDGPLHVINVHLSLNHRHRRAQLRRIQSLIAERCPVDQPLVLAGDFNDWHGRLDRAVIAELGLHSAHAHLPKSQRRTWPAGRPLLNLDRIYLRGLSVRHARRPEGGAWAKLSDHLPLMVELKLDTTR